MKKYIFLGFLTIVIGFIILNNINNNYKFDLNNDSFIAKLSANKLTAKEVVSYFADEKNNDKGLVGRITSEEVIVLDGEKEYTADLKEDEFYLAVAPYIETTHPCGIHNLVSCQGELINKEFNVIIEDENGKTIYDEKRMSLENGFIELWLPKNIKGDITIEYKGLKAKESISTYNGENTCLTTMQLK